MTEEWRTVPGHPSFEVSNLGNVRQLWIWIKDGNRAVYDRPYKRTPYFPYSPNAPWVSYSRDGVHRGFSLRLAVLEAFMGTRPENVCVTYPYYYTGEDPRGAALADLTWRLRKDRRPPSEQFRHEVDLVVKIIQMIREGVRYGEIAKRFGLKGRQSVGGIAWRARRNFEKRQGDPALWLDTPPMSQESRRLRKLAHPVAKGRLVPVEKRAVLGGSLEHLDLHTPELAGSYGGRPHKRQALSFGRGVARRGGQDQRNHDPR